MILNDRDLIILGEVFRWRVCLGRHIKELAGFDGQHTCDRRLRKLIDAGFLERKKVLYGVPSLYFVTRQGKAFINEPYKADKLKLEQINHDIEVLEVAIHLMRSTGIVRTQITTEKELHMQDGFGKAIHRPDFVITDSEGKQACVEVELTPKGKERTINIIKANYVKYDGQLWFVPVKHQRLIKLLNDASKTYIGLKVYELETVKKIK